MMPHPPKIAHRTAVGTAVVPAFLAVALALSPAALAQERVTLTAEDGQPVVGFLQKPVGTPRGGVLMMPGYKSSHAAYEPMMSRLALAGYLALAIDPRGHGESVNDKDGKPVAIDPAVVKTPDQNPFRKTWMDVEAGLKLLTDRGAPAGRLAVIGAGVGAAVALHDSAQHKDHPKALVLMTPGIDELGIACVEQAKAMVPRPALILAADDDSGKGAKALKDVLAYEDAELRLVPGKDITGTGMFGKVPAIEASIISWLDTALMIPGMLEVAECKTVIVDGDLADGEAGAATIVKLPIPGAGDAMIRVSHTAKRLDVAFDVPERYIRLNEVAVLIDAGGKAGRTPDQHCYRISFSPKNPQRKPVVVQRGGLKGWEDSDDKGVIAFGRTEDKKRWTAEIGLDLSRFLPGEVPLKGRIAFQVNGQRTTDIRNFPDDSNVPNTPKTWAPLVLK